MKVPFVSTHTIVNPNIDVTKTSQETVNNDVYCFCLLFPIFFIILLFFRFSLFYFIFIFICFWCHSRIWLSSLCSLGFLVPKHVLIV